MIQIEALNQNDIGIMIDISDSKYDIYLEAAVIYFDKKIQF